MTEEAWNVAASLVILARGNTKAKTLEVIERWIQSTGRENEELKEAALALVEAYGYNDERPSTTTSHRQ
jgi:hypothetical protein